MRGLLGFHEIHFFLFATEGIQQGAGLAWRNLALLLLLGLRGNTLCGAGGSRSGLRLFVGALDVALLFVARRGSGLRLGLGLFLLLRVGVLLGLAGLFLGLVLAFLLLVFGLLALFFLLVLLALLTVLFLLLGVFFVLLLLVLLLVLRLLLLLIFLLLVLLFLVLLLLVLVLLLILLVLFCIFWEYVSRMNLVYLVWQLQQPLLRSQQ